MMTFPQELSELPPVTREFSTFGTPFMSGWNQHTCNIPIIGQYIYDLAIEWIEEPIGPVQALLLIDGCQVATVSWHQPYGTMWFLRFFHNMGGIVTEALYKSKDVSLRLDFVNWHVASTTFYRFSYKVGYVDDDYSKKLLRSKVITTYIVSAYDTLTGGSVMRYYDGIVWFSEFVPLINKI